MCWRRCPTRRPISSLAPARDPRLEDEVKMTMVAAAFPVLQDNQRAREAELQRLLSDRTTHNEDELDVPSFLRRQQGSASSSNRRSFFR